MADAVKDAVDRLHTSASGRNSRSLLASDILTVLKALSDAKAENERVKKTNDHWQKINSENWQAFSAMRDTINEVCHMQSSEADLKKGPEFSVSCEVVSVNVCKMIDSLRWTVDGLYNELSNAVENSQDSDDWVFRARDVLQAAQWAR